MSRIPEGANLESQLEFAFSLEDVPTYYFNGFITTIGSADVAIVLKRQNEVVAILHASHGVAKTFAEKLGGNIAGFEDSLGLDFKTTDDIAERIRKTMEEESDGVEE